MKEFKVIWTEYHDPSNWEGVKRMRKSLQEGKRTFTPIVDFKLSVKLYPDPAENDGWYECDFEAKFPAESVKEAISIVEHENLYDESSSVYSAFEKIKGKWVRSFTEEGIDE
jgi:hypothetical protein